MYRKGITLERVEEEVQTCESWIGARWEAGLYDTGATEHHSTGLI